MKSKIGPYDRKMYGTESGGADSGRGPSDNYKLLIQASIEEE